MNKELLTFAKAIGEPKRLLILNRLKKECCVGEIWECLNLPQNLISHHLRVLKKAKLIKPHKYGLRVIYEVDRDYLNKNLKLLKDYLN